MTAELSRRLAHCGGVSIFERRLPSGEAIYSVIAGTQVVEAQNWNDALIEFKRLVREQTERTLASIP